MKNQPFSASQYIFSSHALAEQFRHLFEAQIVLSYRDPLPPEAWDRAQTRKQEDREKPKFFSWSKIVLRTAALPIGIQKLIVDTVAPLCFSSVLLLFTFIPGYEEALENADYISSDMMNIFALLITLGFFAFAIYRLGELTLKTNERLSRLPARQASSMP